MTFEEQVALLDTLTAAICSGDVNTVRSLYTPDARAWHNNDDIEQTVDQNLAVIAWVAGAIKGLRFDNIRRAPLVDGRVLQQHILRGAAPNGAELDVPSAVVFTFANGKLTRLEEYVDTGRLAALTG